LVEGGVVEGCPLEGEVFVSLPGLVEFPVLEGVVLGGVPEFEFGLLEFVEVSELLVGSELEVVPELG
jgi:hypothetical protein